MAAGGLAGSRGVAFIVSYAMVSDVIAKCCSSPQTGEINAATRSSTLMKWVNIGTAEAAGVVIIAAVADPPMRNAILVGGILALAITYAEYLYANKSGLANPGPGTES
jgi:hypothetical protein